MATNDQDNNEARYRPSARALTRLRWTYEHKAEQASIKAAIAMTEARAAKAMLLHLANIKPNDIEDMAQEIARQFLDG